MELVMIAAMLCGIPNSDDGELPPAVTIQDLEGEETTYQCSEMPPVTIQIDGNVGLSGFWV